MRKMKFISVVTATLFLLFIGSGRLSAGDGTPFPLEPTASTFYNIRDFGAKGDGKTLDTEAINKAIDAASSKGGGTVYFPAGIYLSFSIRLKSNITIYLDNGSTLLAADPAEHKGTYDLPEANEFDMYQDFGHSHWKNSLMWGIGIENFAIIGQGKIDGK